MNIKRGKISITNMQIKSLEKARRLAKALLIIEEECGIHEVDIELENIFICPWIDLMELSKTPMEDLLQGILYKLKG